MSSGSESQPPAALHRAAAGLLGWYQRPALHLVGGPLPASPRPPSRWEPVPPPLQHGIDYAFARHHGTRPVTWPAEASITVRLAGLAGSGAQDALSAVVGELRELTGLELADGEPVPAGLNIAAVPAAEIHVGYLPGATVRLMPGWCSGETGQGGALMRGGHGYAAGYAAVSADRLEPGAEACRGLAALRHVLAHALGLGHAGRRSELMGCWAGEGPASFQRGDRRGLALAGQARAAGITCDTAEEARRP